VNTQQIRQSVKDKWLHYYAENREWLARLGVWVNCEGQRRPSSGFILAALSTLEPQLTLLLPLIVDLSHNPDRIVMALGLNFNPDEELAAIAQKKADTDSSSDGAVKLLPAAAQSPLLVSEPPATIRAARLDEACQGSRD